MKIFPLLLILTFFLICVSCQKGDKGEKGIKGYLKNKAEEGDFVLDEKYVSHILYGVKRNHHKKNFQHDHRINHPRNMEEYRSLYHKMKRIQKAFNKVTERLGEYMNE